nr:MBL fold metallo-hydrolase [uncultured Desulfobacter sp.]
MEMDRRQVLKLATIGGPAYLLFNSLVQPSASAVAIEKESIQPAMSRTGAALKKISDSVYSYVGIPEGTPGHAFSANAGIVVGKDAVLVVDTLTSAREAERFLADIRTITDKPIRYVVNTHYHLDHALGNCVFTDTGATVIGHARCRESIIKNKDNMLKNPTMFGLPEEFWVGTKVKVPYVSFESEMVIDLGDVTVKLIYNDVASHTAGSIVVAVQEQKVLFAGDILFTDFHPYLGEGDLPGWAQTLDTIHAMDVDHIIPGHGPLSKKKDLEDMKSYLSFFDKQATKLSAGGNDAEKIAEALLKMLPKRSGGRFIVGYNLKTRYLKKP